MKNIIKKIRFIDILSFLFYLLFFILLLKNSWDYLDNDFGWHLKVGEEIYLNKRIPAINHYNYIFSENNNFWVDHEWLSNYLIFIIYDKLGYPTLNIIFALLILATLIIANNFITQKIIKNSKSIYLLFSLEILGILAISPHLGIRIQEISILFLLLQLIIIYLFENRSLKKNKNNWKILIWLIPLFYLWANLHAGFLIGIFILFFYLGIKIIEKIIYYYKNKLFVFLSSFLNLKRRLSKKNLKIFFIFSSLSLVSTTLTPYGLKLFDFLYSYKNNAYSKIIFEWLPQYYYPFVYWQILYIGIIITILILFFITNKKNKQKIDLWNLFLILLFVFLAIKSKRHFPLLFIVSLPFLIKYLYKDFKIFFENKTKKKNYYLEIILKTYLILTLIIVISSIALKINIAKNPFTYFCKEYPCEATTFLKNNHKIYKNKKIFNDYGWGGYLIYTYPEKKLFIDGRLPQKQLKNHSYLEEYLSFFNSEENILISKINEYNIELFLLAKEKEYNFNILDRILLINEENLKQENKLINFLEKNIEWKKIYEDEISVIYAKE